VLVEDLPNILHPTVRARFHDALRAHVERASDVAPVVLVVSDAGVRVEGDSNGSRDRDLVVDARAVVPPGLSASLVSEIRSVVVRQCHTCFFFEADRCAQIQCDRSYATHFCGEARDSVSQCAALTEYAAFDRGRCRWGCA
jgi:hypothetical protein